MTDTNKMREEFEAAFIAQQVEAFGENYRSGAVYRLKREGEFEKPPTAYELHRREQGMYDDYWIEMLWWAWQASRQAVVVELPPVPPVPEDPEEAIDDSHMDAYHAEVRMRSACVKSVEAQGLRVGVKS